MLRNLITAILLFTSLSAFAQSRMSSAETSYLYDADHEFLLDHRIAAEGNKYKVFLRFRLNSGMVKISDYSISYDLRTSYIDEKLINGGVKIDTAQLINTGYREFFYAFEFERKSNHNLLVVQVNNVSKDKKYFKDILISSENTPDFQSFLVFDAESDLPVFDRYINAERKIKVTNVFGNTGSFSITGRENNAPIAIPPFDDTSKKKLNVVSIDTIYGVNANESFQLATPGFYEITSNDVADHTTGLLVKDDYFPWYSDYARLIMPLIYISTNQEFTSMLKADVKKDVFESFVLTTISKNPNIGNEFIKYYYRRLRKSAKLFSTSIEGWKTDRGMVYQIFGDPVQVFRNENTELWVYSLEGGGRTRFIFDIVPGPGGIIEHKLIRGKKYKQDWMSAVSRWRSGRIIE